MLKYCQNNRRNVGKIVTYTLTSCNNETFFTQKLLNIIINAATFMPFVQVKPCKSIKSLPNTTQMESNERKLEYHQISQETFGMYSTQ